MAAAQQINSSKPTSTTRYEGGLARTLVRTLLIFTFIPLIVMAGAAYLRSRALLQQQVVGQMQSQLQYQLAHFDDVVKTKEIRLDRVTRTPALQAKLAAVITGSGAVDPNVVRADVLAVLRGANAQSGRPTFNEFFLAGNDGKIVLASKPLWQGTALRDTPYFATLAANDHASFSIYDAAALYPKQLILASVSRVRSSDGAAIGMLVGITEPEDLQAVLNDISALNTNSQALFVMPGGTVVGNDEYTNQASVLRLPAAATSVLNAAMTNVMKQGSTTPATVQFTDTNGSASFGQLAWLDSIHAGVLYEIQQDTVFGPLNSLIPFTVILFVVTLAAMGLVLYFGAQRVVHPLVQLANITQRFAQGDFSARAEARSKDEIGMLAQSFNGMAEQLSDLYRTLEDKVEQRTRQIHTAAEVAQRITSTARLDELLNRTVQLIVDQFSFYQASIFMIDQRGKYAVLQAAYGPAAKEMLARGHRLEVGSASIIGWATANRQPRVASDVEEDPIHLRNDLLPQTRSEVGIPITIGNLVLGALDVQSTQPNAFGPDTIVMLQLIASQIAVAIQNVGLVQSTQVDLQDLQRMQQSTREIAASQSSIDALQALERVLKDSPYTGLVMALEGKQLRLAQNLGEARTDDQQLREVGPAAARWLSTGALRQPTKAEGGDPENARLRAAVWMLQERLEELTGALTLGPVAAETESPRLPIALAQFARQLGYQSVAFLPIFSGDRLAGVVSLGARTRALNETSIRPYSILADLTGITLERIGEASQKAKELSQRESLASITQAISASSSDFSAFFEELHQQVQRNIGDYAFSVALFDKSTQAISIPYMYEEGRVDKVQAFPLGEGLSSVLIRSGKPLLLAEDVEHMSAQLGAKVVGRAARSWMGAPMTFQDEAIGALIVQDLEHEHAFSQEDLNFFTALAGQVATVIHTARLLEESRARTVQLETAAEIARDVSGSLNLDELLVKSVDFIRERFDFYHAAIFLLDPTGEYAVIREATGEAGVQMKRTGHKLAVGSKSIVGYVSGRGEPLVVNDTTKDATYFANPLLPGTRSEAAMPLKVGERIVGVMDVQSSHPYAFTADSLRTLRILADQLGVAVVNSELFAETQEHLSQHRLLHHITTSAASGTTLEEALESAVTGLQVTLGGDRVMIQLMDAEKKHLEVKAQAGYSEDIMQMRVEVGQGVTGWVAMHHKPLRIGNVAEDPRYMQASANTASELALPLLYRNEVLGVLNVESEQTNAYTPDDEEMLGTLGGSLAAVIANARLLEQLRAQAERERAIYEITSKIRRSTNIEAILATTASELTKAVGARQAHIQISTGTDGDRAAEKVVDA